MSERTDPTSIQVEKVEIKAVKGRFRLRLYEQMNGDYQEMTVDDMYIYSQWRAMYLGNSVRADGKKFPLNIKLYMPDSYTPMMLYFATNLENDRQEVFDENGLRQVYGGSFTILPFHRARPLRRRQ